MAGATAPAAADAGEPKEEQTVFNVMLSEMGANKIGVIKAVRELVPTLGLQEAKTLVESGPKEVLTGSQQSDSRRSQKEIGSCRRKGRTQVKYFCRQSKTPSRDFCEYCRFLVQISRPGAFDEVKKKTAYRSALGHEVPIHY